VSVYRSVHVRRGDISALTDRRHDTLMEIGRILGRDSWQAFNRQAMGATPWVPRRIMNVPGAIADLAAGPRILERRFAGRPALVDYGTLKKKTVDWPANVRLGSTTASKVPNVVTLVIRHPAARTHQEGGQSAQQVYQASINNLRTYLRRTRQRRDEERPRDPAKAEKLQGRLAVVRRQMGWMLGKSPKGTLVTRVPARPYLGPTDEAMDRIVSLVVRRAKKR
jgi:hypothetical protein